MKRKYFLNRKTGRMKRLIFFLASFCTIACCQAESNIVINEEKTFVCQSDSASYNCSFCKKLQSRTKTRPMLPYGSKKTFRRIEKMTNSIFSSATSEILDCIKYYGSMEVL